MGKKSFSFIGPYVWQKKLLEAVAHPGGVSGVEPLHPFWNSKKQHNFIDVTQFVTLCYIYF